MTGNFKIIVIQNKRDNKFKWTIHKDNVKEKYLYSLCSYNPLTTRFKNKQELKNLLQANKENLIEKADTDEYRKLTLSEYLILGQNIKHYKMRYNKKKDILITK